MGITPHDLVVFIRKNRRIITIDRKIPLGKNVGKYITLLIKVTIYDVSIF